MYPYIAAVLVTLFLASVTRFYHPETGFTSLIAFPEDDTFTFAALRSVPHHQYVGQGGYDGQFYAARALDPLFSDPETDRAMDLAPFRARRILFSWTAYVAGLGRPAWILEAYALQNVVCWLLLAVVLTRWLPPTSARGLALWAACLFSHGMLWSVRLSLLDGPSLLLIAWAVAAVERGRPLLSAVIVGIAGLARETNLLAISAQPVPADRRTTMRLAIAFVVAAVPVLIWYDFLRSIYRASLLTDTHPLALPGTGLATVWSAVVPGVARNGLSSPDGYAFFLLAALAVQAGYLVFRREYAMPWWRIGIAYALLMLFLHPELVHPRTGAISRVLLGMTVGFNVVLATERRASRFWPWFVLGNLHLIPAWRVLPLVAWP